MAVAFLAVCLPSSAQSADMIIGDYESVQNNNDYRVRVSKNSDGSFKAQIYWVKNAVDPATGKKWLDPKNPDKSLRNTPCDRIVLFDGLRFNSGKNQWDGAKIYDPFRGIRANLTGWFETDGRLCLKGSLFGISETVYWTKVK